MTKEKRQGQNVDLDASSTDSDNDSPPKAKKSRSATPSTEATINSRSNSPSTADDEFEDITYAASTVPKPSVADKSPEQELFKAVLEDNLEAVKRLLEKDPGLIKSVDPHGRSVLHMGNTDKMLELLLDYYANLNQDPNCTTPLHIAISTNNTY